LGSNEKITKLTSWEPKVTLEKGLEETIDFFKANLKKYKSDVYNI